MHQNEAKLQNSSSEIMSDGKADSLIPHFPVTRFMGSKRKLLPFIARALDGIKFNSVLDAFSGSGSVSYFFKNLGKEVSSNDYLAYSYHITHATIENKNQKVSAADLQLVLKDNRSKKNFIQETFNGLYFTPQDNLFLDNVSANIKLIKNKYKRSLLIASLCRAALKKQPRGVFTVVGQRYDDGRKDLRLSMREHFINSVKEFNDAVFDNGKKNKAFNGDIFKLKESKFDLIYFDPPYYSTRSDNDYIRRYHFIEGLATYWENVKIRENSINKRLEKRPTPFSSKASCYEAFHSLFKQFPKGMFLVSYSSNSLPTKNEMIDIMKEYRRTVQVFKIPHKYSFGNHAHKVGSNRNAVEEYLFLGI